MSKIIPFPEPARLTFPTPENCEPLSKEEIDAFYDNMFRNEYLRCVFDDILSEAGHECQPHGYIFMSTAPVSEDPSYDNTPDGDVIATAFNKDGSHVKIVGYGYNDTTTPEEVNWPNKAFESDNIFIHTVASKILKRFTYATVESSNPLTIRFGNLGNTYITLETIR